MTKQHQMAKDRPKDRIGQDKKVWNRTGRNGKRQKRGNGKVKINTHIVPAQ